MATEDKIQPAIGIARVSNSPDEFFIGRQRIGQLTELQGGFKDAQCRVKRQAARFRFHARIRSLMFAASLLLLVPVPSGAQVAVEVIGHTGAMNAIADEGFLGTLVPFGGSIAVSPTSKIAVELDFQVSHVRQQRTAETRSWRRLYLTPGIFYRWRSQERTSVFFGGGLGLHEETHTSGKTAGVSCSTE